MWRGSTRDKIFQYYSINRAHRLRYYINKNQCRLGNVLFNELVFLFLTLLLNTNKHSIFHLLKNFGHLNIEQAIWSTPVIISTFAEYFD